jgi:hypothetical protein
MSPEQARGQPADARSDQFSFSVALWEALFSQRPFDAHAAPENRHAPATPRGREVPAWVHAVVARGLSSDADARWPSMSALLEALGRDPAERRRRWISGVVALGLIGLAVAGSLGVLRRPPLCGGAVARLAGVWDAPRKQRLERAFLESGAADAADAWSRARDILDRYAQRWVGTHEETCRATRVEGRQSEALLDLRMACLDRRRAILAALGDLWSGRLTDKAVNDAPTAAKALPPLDECSDVDALTAPLALPKDPAQQAKIEAVRQRLDRIQALSATSKWQEAATEATAARKEADAIGYAPLTAEAALGLAVATFQLSEPSSVELSEEAARQGALAHDDRLTPTP